MSTDSPFPPPPQISEKEAADIRTAAFNMTAIYADRFIINCHGGMVRISVAEQAGTPENIALRGCFIMNNTNAKELANLILRMVQDQESLAAGQNAATVSGEKIH